MKQGEGRESSVFGELLEWLYWFLHLTSILLLCKPRFCLSIRLSAVYMTDQMRFQPLITSERNYIDIHLVHYYFFGELLLELLDIVGLQIFLIEALPVDPQNIGLYNGYSAFLDIMASWYQ